jgi:DivIVA domain-containing protein
MLPGEQWAAQLDRDGQVEFKRDWGVIILSVVFVSAILFFGVVTIRLGSTTVGALMLLWILLLLPIVVSRHGYRGPALRVDSFGLDLGLVPRAQVPWHEVRGVPITRAVGRWGTPAGSWVDIDVSERFAASFNRNRPLFFRITEAIGSGGKRVLFRIPTLADVTVAELHAWLEAERQRRNPSGDGLASGTDATPPSGPPFTLTRLREGYDIAQVDAFIADVVTRMAIEPPTVRVEEIRTARFKPVRLKQGYEMREVDAYLDHLEAERRKRSDDTLADHSMAHRPPAPPFTLTRLREGYDVEEVDAFIADVVARMATEPPTVGAEEIQTAWFKPVRLKQGYEMGEVDLYLDSLKAALKDR